MSFILCLGLLGVVLRSSLFTSSLNGCRSIATGGSTAMGGSVALGECVALGRSVALGGSIALGG